MQLIFLLNFTILHTIQKNIFSHLYSIRLCRSFIEDQSSLLISCIDVIFFGRRLALHLYLAKVLFGSRCAIFYQRTKYMSTSLQKIQVPLTSAPGIFFFREYNIPEEIVACYQLIHPGKYPYFNMGSWHVAVRPDNVPSVKYSPKGIYYILIISNGVGNKLPVFF